MKSPTKIYHRQNVRDAALERIVWLFDEFPDVAVTISGGKDSTVLLYLAMEVAHAKGRLPLRVMWIDQEAEWQGTVDTVEAIMRRADVDPHWLQVPFRLLNATSNHGHWLHPWDPASREKWVHPQADIAIIENRYGTDRFLDLFGGWAAHHYEGRRLAVLSGVRCEESEY